MDPNKTLADLRGKMKEAREAAPFSEDEWAWNEIAELFEALDDWLRNGGFLPEDWRRGTR